MSSSSPPTGATPARSSTAPRPRRRRRVRPPRCASSVRRVRRARAVFLVLSFACALPAGTQSRYECGGAAGAAMRVLLVCQVHTLSATLPVQRAQILNAFPAAEVRDRGDRDRRHRVAHTYECWCWVALYLYFLRMLHDASIIYMCSCILLYMYIM